MKVGDTDSVKNRALTDAAGKGAEAISAESRRSKKADARDATALNDDQVTVSSYAELDPNKLRAERQAKVDALKKLIQEGGIQNYLASVPTTQLIQKMSEEVGFIREFVGPDASSE